MAKTKAISAFVPSPVLMLTAARDEFVVEHSIAAGACDLIARPLDKSMLPSRLRGLLSQDGSRAA